MELEDEQLFFRTSFAIYIHRFELIIELYVDGCIGQICLDYLPCIILFLLYLILNCTLYMLVSLEMPQI
jgi:hypothetical protein